MIALLSPTLLPFWSEGGISLIFVTQAPAFCLVHFGQASQGHIRQAPAICQSLPWVFYSLSHSDQ